MGGQRDASLLKMYPCTQGVSRAPCGLRVGATLGLVGGTWGWDQNLGSRCISLPGLCTSAKLCSFLALAFLIYKMGRCGD